MNGQGVAPLAGAFFLLTACGGGGGGDNIDRNRVQVMSQFDGADPNANGEDTPDAVARLYSAPDGQVRLEMTEGPMAGMVILCEDSAGLSCHVNAGGVGATGTGSLQHRLSGRFAYVGTFAVQHHNNGTTYNNTHHVHGANPSADTHRVRLPDGSRQFDGQFVAGAGFGDTGGIATGDVMIFANFDTAVVSGTMDGALNDGAGPEISVVFNDLALDRATAGFATTDASRITFADARAWGEIDGAFYGPQAEEAAGSFSFGNDAGGMSGIFLACQRGTTCID